MTNLMGEINAAEREFDRQSILSDMSRVGYTATMFELVNRLGMDIEAATDEVYREILKLNGEAA